MEHHAQLRVENSELRRNLGEREAKIRQLDERVLALNQIRQDVAKHIDDLIAQVDLLDSRLGAVEKR